MKQIVLGTAGHIDHGKTSLIKALTGIETDRLKEEKARGITIELGFASMDLPSGQHLGIVDVPGHEKFVKNMVAGATGIDIVALVIAADEGVMPQTREHMEICTLLDIRHGLVALTKTDMVDEEWLALVTEDIRGFVQGTFLENAPIVPVSSVTGTGLPDFIKTLEGLCGAIQDRPDPDLFRLPIDRVFTMKGFGTVITGTLISGKIGLGETVMIYPSGITSKIRGIQVHNQSVAIAHAGMRTAINFQGLDKASVNRGEMMAYPNTLKPSYMLDASLHFLKSNDKPMKHRTRVRFHSGTSEVMGTLNLLDRDELLPGETVEVQLRFDSQVVGVRDDRFVLRSYSPVRTIGGGRILNPIPKKHKRFKSDIIQGLKGISEQAPEYIIAFHVSEAGYEGLSFSDLKLMTNLSDKQLNTIVSALLNHKILIQADKENRIYIHKETLESLIRETGSILSAYHATNPLKATMPKGELRSKFPSSLEPRLFNLLLVQMTKRGELVQEEDTVRLASHKVSLGQDQADIKDKILTAYKHAELSPPYFKELCKSFDIDPKSASGVLQFLIEEGKVIKVKEDLYFHADVLSRLKARLIDFLTRHGEISTPQLKEITGASRKYVIPLIEYFDANNITIRIGDIRKLRKG